VPKTGAAPGTDPFEHLEQQQFADSCKQRSWASLTWPSLISGCTFVLEPPGAVLLVRFDDGMSLESAVRPMPMADGSTIQRAQT